MPAAEPYYLDNFTRAIDWIAQRHGDLLDASERAFLADFVALPLSARALLVRMLMRRGVHFRASKLQYDEIGCPVEAAAPMLALGWLDGDPSLSLDALFALSTRAQLAQLLPRSLGTASLTKSAWLAALRDQYPAPRRYAQWAGADCDDPLFHVTIASLCERLRLMFFGNLHQDWSTFVLADLGIFHYENVSFSPDARAFQQRADVDAYLALQQWRDALDDPAVLASDAALADVVEGLLGVATENAWIVQRRDKCLFRAGQAAERMQFWDVALAAYDRSAWPGARHRRMRVMERCGREDEALTLALYAMAAPESDAEAQRVARLHTRLARKRSSGNVGNTEITLPPARRASRTRPVERAHLVLPRYDAARETIAASVEMRVHDALASDDAPVFYVENTLLCGLFGLLCWDAVFAPLPGAFFHPFQRGPADLGAPDFVARRKALFDAALTQLDDRRYRRTILARWREKTGIQSPFVHWGALRREAIVLALRCIPATHLKACFLRLLSEPNENRTGFPDLIQFWPRTRRYEMIEVKGPGDRLQDNQIRWLVYFGTHGIPARVVDVTWAQACDMQASVPMPMACGDRPLRS